MGAMKPKRFYVANFDRSWRHNILELTGDRHGYDDFLDAKRRATKLASKFSGRYYVLEIVGSVKASCTEWEEYE